MAAAAAMTQFANYGRGLSDPDNYRNAHMAPYRTPVEFPQGYVVPGPGAAAYMPPGAPHLSYYRQYYGEFPPGVGPDGLAGGIPASEVASKVTPPSGPGPGSGSEPPLTSRPKESILQSLLATHSDRAAMDGDDSSSVKADDSSGKQQVAATTKRVDEGQKVNSTEVKTEGPHSAAATGASETRASREQCPPGVNPQHGRYEVAGLGGPAATAAAAVAGGSYGGAAGSPNPAVTAMHIVGLHGGFPGDIHAMTRGMGSIPPTIQGVSPAGAIRMPYVPAPAPPSLPAQSLLPPSPAAPAMSPHPIGFANHDAYEEHLRQQEKKQQKRAANRKSAQLSRKRKKALIEELRYENQDLQRHEDILAVIPDPVFAFDTADGRVWFASNSASAQFGLPVEDLTSACFFDLMTEDCSKRLRVLIDTASKDITDTNSVLLHEVRRCWYRR